MFENIDWGQIEIEYNEFENIDSKIHLYDQINLLKEDMFSAKFDKYIIDVFFNQETEEFVISLIRNDDWENPLMERATNDLKWLEKIMKEFVEFVTL